MILRINDRLTASRFLRKFNTPGGVACDINKGQAKQICNELITIENLSYSGNDL
jgi:Ni,Fe-hydrogenase III large subunit